MIFNKNISAFVSDKLLFFVCLFVYLFIYLFIYFYF